MAAEARRRLAAGEKMRSIISDLGVVETSLRHWMQQHPERALQPVRIATAASVSGDIALVTPDGFRVEGLDLAGAARLLGWLR
jgi:transposase-like protein